MSDVIARSSRVCAGLHSAPVSRSFETRTGAASVVVAISFLLPRCGVSRVPRRFRRRHRFRNMTQYLFENSEEFANLFCADDQGGEEAQRKFVRAIDQEAAFHGFGDERSAVDGEFNADHEAFTADFFDEGVFGSQLLDATANFSAASGGIG